MTGDSGAPARREAGDDEHAPQLVSHGGRSTIARPQPNPADWLRHGSGDGGWESVVVEGSDE